MKVTVEKTVNYNEYIDIELPHYFSYTNQNKVRKFGKIDFRADNQITFQLCQEFKDGDMVFQTTQAEEVNDLVYFNAEDADRKHAIKPAEYRRLFKEFFNKIKV